MPIGWTIAKFLFKVLAPSIPEVISTVASLRKPQQNPDQKPDLEKPDPGEKPANSVWVGFRCVVELEIDD